MTVVVIGLGSMGKRRIRLIAQSYKDAVILGVDTSEERRTAAQAEFGIKAFASVDEAAAVGAQCAFVCTSPLSHATIINRCLNLGMHIFTELNLVSDGYDENMRLAEEKGLVLFLSSTFLYRAEINHVISRVHESDCRINYNYHIGQYLPDWHPWESYNSYFIGDARTNGCREILAVELPWIVSCFGDIESIQAISDKATSLNISYNDNMLMLITHKDGSRGMLAVDVVCRKAVRHLEVYGEKLHITWDGKPETLFDYNIAEGKDEQVDICGEKEHRDGYASFIVENPYIHEIEDFIATVIDRTHIPKWSFAQDRRVLELIDRAGV